MQRPLGPRKLRASSPAPPVNLPETSPLIIKKSQKSLSPPIDPNAPPARSPPSQLSLSIPGSRSRPTTPKPKIQLSIPLSVNGVSGHGGDYYGGPNGPSVLSPASEAVDGATIRPPSSTTTTVPQATQKEPLADIKDMMTKLEIRQTPPSELPNPHPDDDVVSAPAQALPWSDDVLEELSRLGEGAGGAVHKVRDKRTATVMARKTITTREAPMKQLLREVSIISSTEHINIIRFYGAYMSPSSSEVKIVMEFCEGGSLESVGKRIKELRGVVGEKVAGRIAEGVSILFQSTLRS